jgi:hypothetical protein
MFGLNAPFTFKTYQDVKNNLFYWTVMLLFASSIAIYLILLNQSQQKQLRDFVVEIGNNGLIATIVSGLILAAYVILATVLVWGIQIHDLVYDRYIIKWRMHFDVEFILARLTEQIRNLLPNNFLELAAKNRYAFMKPYYDFVGDGKKGIEENTRIRFYERVVWYWITQLNEIFILLFLVGVPLYVLINNMNPLTTTSLAVFILVLVSLGLLNRWLVTRTRSYTAQATIDEIDEILSKEENIKTLLNKYIELCKKVGN